MNFDSATVLGSSTDYFYFGENTYNYKAKQNLNLEGFLIDSGILTGDSSSITSTIDGFLSTDTIEEVIINGEVFGEGKLLQLNFPYDNSSPNAKKINATLEIYKTGNLVGFPVAPNSPQFLESLSENFSFSQDSEPKKSFNYSVDISYLDTEVNDPLGLAHSLASNLIDENLSSSLITDFDPATYKSYSVEKADVISRTYSLSREYDLTTEGNNYDYNLNLSAKLGKDGVTTVTERGNVRGIVGADKDTLFQNAKDGMDDLIASSYSRNETYFDDFVSPLSTHDLFNKRISTNKTYNKYNGTAQYQIVYSNDPAINADYNWTYTSEIRKNEGVYSLSENGEIVGDGKPLPINGSSSIENAQSAWNTIQAGIENRIQSLYNSNSNDFRPLNLINQDVSYSELDGTITYGYGYSSESKEVDGGISSKAIFSESLPVDLKNNFAILNDREIPQKLNLATVGSSDLRMELFGKKDTTYSDYKAYVNKNISKYYPSSSFKELVYIKSADFTIDPRNNTAFLRATWNWNRRSEDIDEL